MPPRGRGAVPRNVRRNAGPQVPAVRSEPALGPYDAHPPDARPALHAGDHRTRMAAPTRGFRQSAKAPTPKCSASSARSEAGQVAKRWDAKR